MELIVRIPEELVEPIRHRLPPPQMGILEAIALDAILQYFTKLAESTGSGDAKGS